MLARMRINAPKLKTAFLGYSHCRLVFGRVDVPKFQAAFWGSIRCG